MVQLKRAYFDIVASLLEEVSERPLSKTTLASRANLDTRATQRYLDLIIKTKLLANDNNDNTFRITTKGQEFLHDYRKLKLYLET